MLISINRSTYGLKRLRLISQAYIPTVTLSPVCLLAKLQGHIKINCERKRPRGQLLEADAPLKRKKEGLPVMLFTLAGALQQKIEKEMGEVTALRLQK